jgi:pantoate--beta-alanine ligase
VNQRITTNLVRLATDRTELHDLLGDTWRQRSLGFVPTMGALHAGHVELVRHAAAHSRVVVSIFVNPAQFGPGEDLDRYPRTLRADIELLEDLGTPVIVYAPSAEELYRPGEELRIQLPGLSSKWEGTERPGHFDGVCLVLAKLFAVVGPTCVYMGQKDFQQTVVVRRLLRELLLPIELVVVPTVREADGLALSSRNRFLSAEQRAQAPILIQTLRELAEQIVAGRAVPEALREARDVLSTYPECRLDYLDMVDGENLEPMLHFDAAQGPTAIVAARFGSTRLLDNLPLMTAQQTAPSKQGT